MAKRACAVPGCKNALYSGNRTGVCRAHNHTKGYCLCVQCGYKPGDHPPRPTYRVKTEAELEAEGLLPTKRLRTISLAPMPWKP